ncbi:MAG: hypothetical protein ACYTED_19590 [Planctomycetota bacterium]
MKPSTERTRHTRDPALIAAAKQLGLGAPDEDGSWRLTVAEFVEARIEKSAARVRASRPARTSRQKPAVATARRPVRRPPPLHDRIRDPRLRRAVGFALWLMRRGEPPGLANYRAATRFDVSVREVARHTGQVGARARARRQKRRP